MGRRHKARELLVQALYAADLTDGDLERTIADQVERRNPSPEALEYVQHLSSRLTDNREQLDQRVNAALTGWSAERVSAVERCILRLATAEMTLEGVPARVAINEAVELARTFSGEDAARFVNGVLDRLRRDADETAPMPDAGPGAADGTDPLPS